MGQEIGPQMSDSEQPSAQSSQARDGRRRIGEFGRRANYGLRHLSGLPPVVWRTRSTRSALPGFISLALSIASACVGKTSLALSELGFLTA
jgi:hypothetical protein